MTFATQLEQDRLAAEAALAEYFCPDDTASDGLLEAMRYSLLAGGKRLRPILVLETCHACGGERMSAMPAACAVEMLHTYSLIHDDLPCMDDDTMRRGKPTCHIAYDVCTALLAGDTLQAEAFSAIASSTLSAEKRAECMKILAWAAGSQGICGGQYLDTTARSSLTTADAYLLMYRMKTASLFRAACCMGAICADADQTQRKAAADYADALGMAFQIQDDVLDATANMQQLGKDPGSDARSGKPTFLSLYGMAACAKKIRTLTDEACQSAARLSRPEFLIALAEQLTDRRM